MKTFLTLLKINLNLNFGLSALKYRFTREKKKRWEPILVTLAIIAGTSPLVVFYTFIMLGAFKTGLSINQPEIVLTLSFLLGQMLVLIFGIFYIMSTLYFSRDMNILIPMPLKPYEVLGSKFAVIMINEYLTMLPILLPPAIIYGVGMKQTFLYWVKAVVLMLASPVIPLVLDAMFLLVIMRFINIRRNKDLFAILGGFLGIFLAIGINFFAQKMPEGNEEEFMRNLLIGQTKMIDLIGSKFPPSIWATRALSQTDAAGFLYLLMFIGVSVIIFIVLLWLANHIFYKSVLAGQEASRRRKKLSESEAEHQYSKFESPVAAIFWREWKLLVRTPVYMLNGLSGVVIGPVLIIVMLFSQKSGETKELFELINKPGMDLQVTLGALALVLFTCGMNLAASTAVSREGQTFWISKMIPVSPKQQVLGKFLNALSVSVLGIIIMTGMLAIFFTLPVFRAVIIILIGSASSIVMTSLNLVVDVLHPKLSWNNPQEAMKQNMNGLLGMIISLVVIGVLAASAVPMMLFKLPEWLIYTVLMLIAVIASVPSLLGLFAAAESSYKRLEM